MQIAGSLRLQIAACLKQNAAEMIADCWTWMSWIVGRMMIAGRSVVVALISAWIVVARAVVVLAPAVVAAAVVEVAIAVVVEAFADRVQICFYAACGLNGFS